jgi:D-alanyl-lipoteichoic acid acyltransferase DltB (MBOAT superfamily)
MLFNSYEFIFMFLPVVFILFYALRRFRQAAFLWLIGASLFFYSFWNTKLLPVILFSLLFNYGFVQLLRRKPSKPVLAAGIIVNLGMLGYYKYFNFFIENVNALFSADIRVQQIVLPLAISFFTFQQVAYLVDTYRGETRGHTVTEYVLFVVFFPQLIAGPIVKHDEMFPQFKNPSLFKIQWSNIEKGLTIFFIGLFKKTVIADTLAIWVQEGFDRSVQLNMVEGWISALSYTFQLYFDFSGYCDMAIGIALLFNIRLPVNFNSPYQSLNIQEFWKRWHMTLNRFLTTYLYIPLGGSKKGNARTYVNIMIVFLISGLWHGAGWTFIFWGFLHGLASVVCRLWRKTGITLAKPIAWAVTFLFVVFAWVFFRADNFTDAVNIVHAMVSVRELSFALIWQHKYTLFGLFLLLLIVLFAKNSVSFLDTHNATWRRAFFVASLAVASVLHLNQVSEFLYFNF